MCKFKKCEKCGSKKDITRHHVLPKMYGVYFRNKRFHPRYMVKDWENFIFKTVALCRKCHNKYEAFANELKYELHVHFNTCYFAESRYYVEDPELRKLASWANSYFNVGKQGKKTILRQIAEKLCMVVEQITEALLNKLKKIKYRFVNPIFERFENVFPNKIDKVNFVHMWRNHYYNWLYNC